MNTQLKYRNVNQKFVLDVSNCIQISPVAETESKLKFFGYANYKIDSVILILIL